MSRAAAGTLSVVLIGFVSDALSSGQESDVDSSHSVCSGSDTHSGHTSLSGLTEKNAPVALNLSSLSSAAECANVALLIGTSSSGTYTFVFVTFIHIVT